MTTLVMTLDLYEFGVKQQTADVVIKKDLWFLLEICIESDIDLTLDWVDEYRKNEVDEDNDDVLGLDYGKDAIERLNKILNGKESYRKTTEGDYIVPMHEHDIHVLCDALDAFKEFVLDGGLLSTTTQIDDFTNDMNYFMSILRKEVQHIRYDKCMDCSGSVLEDTKFYSSCCYVNCYERRGRS
jgi:hypothetical protein